MTAFCTARQVFRYSGISLAFGGKDWISRNAIASGVSGRFWGGCFPLGGRGRAGPGLAGPGFCEEVFPPPDKAFPVGAACFPLINWPLPLLLYRWACCGTWPSGVGGDFLRRFRVMGVFRNDLTGYTVPCPGQLGEPASEEALDEYRC